MMGIMYRIPAYLTIHLCYEPSGTPNEPRMKKCNPPPDYWHLLLWPLFQHMGTFSFSNAQIKKNTLKGDTLGTPTLLSTENMKNQTTPFFQ